MNFEELVEDLDAVQRIEFKNYLLESLKDYCHIKSSNSKIISNNTFERYCNSCGCKLRKNGTTKTGVQKYICSGCKKTSSETTNTITYHSKVSFDVWSNVIDNLLDGFSIRRIAEENSISNTTSFSLRHKVLLALKSFVESIELQQYAQVDEKYFSINLKGTKPKNMPRFSKKRKTSNKGRGKKNTGMNHHKICVLSGVDYEGNLVLKIAGLGKCSTEMIEDSIGSQITRLHLMITDSCTAYRWVCFDHGVRLRAVPSGKHGDIDINIQRINNVHSQLETWLAKFKGISTRHLQEYLDWFTYIYMMKKKYKYEKIKTDSYRLVILNDNYVKGKDILSKSMPIDLNIAYAEYKNQSLS